MGLGFVGLGQGVGQCPEHRRHFFSQHRRHFFSVFHSEPDSVKSGKASQTRTKNSEDDGKPVIVVVDDEPVNCKMVRAFQRGEGERERGREGERMHPH